MRAAVCHAFGEPLVIEEIGLAEPGPGEVRISVHACGVCHSDIFFMDGAWGGVLPAVYGHEAAGIVKAIGPGVTSVKIGQPVVATLIRSCGTCHSCTHGHEVSCENLDDLGPASPISSKQGAPIHQAMATGAFADEIVVHESQTVTAPVGLDMAALSLLACGVITGFGAVVNNARVEPGASVVVIGAGGVGLNTIQGARYAGASMIAAIDLSSTKLENAGRFGATHPIDGADSEKAREHVLRLTGGRGADYVFVTVGARSAMMQAFDYCASSGAIVWVGMPPSGVTLELDPSSIAANNQRIIGSKMGDAAIRTLIPQLIDLYQAGSLELDALVSGRYPLEGVNDAVTSARTGDVFRNVIMMRQ